jgi:hypothetical protein
VRRPGILCRLMPLEVPFPPTTARRLRQADVRFRGTAQLDRMTAKGAKQAVLPTELVVLVRAEAPGRLRGRPAGRPDRLACITNKTSIYS